MNPEKKIKYNEKDGTVEGFEFLGEYVIADLHVSDGFFAHEVGKEDKLFKGEFELQISIKGLAEEDGEMVLKKGDKVKLILMKL